jgi:hypothetical protein
VQITGPEVHFFDKNFRRGLEWYAQKMPEVGPDQLAVEKTPGETFKNLPTVQKRFRKIPKEVPKVLTYWHLIYKAECGYVCVSYRNPHFWPNLN